MSGSINQYVMPIVKKGIFKNINSFEEFEKRLLNAGNISGRGTQTTKGDIFEIFVEALLSVNKRYKKDKVYPSSKVPLNIKNELNLNLSKKEMGQDGCYIDNGDLCLYQAKYRTPEQTLNWAKLSTFAGVSERAKIRHLFTTTNKIKDEFKNKDRVLITSRKDLLNLSKEEFKEIETWLSQPKPKRQWHKKDPYQKDAIKSIIKELKTHDRATTIMACGTGKTDIGLWVYEKLNPKICAVFVPSIALIKQIRADWLEQIKISNFETIQICSSKDTSQREDELKIQAIDLDFLITTETNVIRKFIEKNPKPKIIFCTYQSSLKLGDALNGKAVDFAVFDEAHRTASLVKKKNQKFTHFNYALYDENIKITKRLFMTATRRIAGSKKKEDVIGQQLLSATMDKKEIYGNVCYSLSFLKAAEIGAIAKIKVITTVVTSEEAEKEIRNKSGTIINGQAIKTEQVAKQIAIRKAVDEHKINKLFSFHSSKTRAHSFVRNTSEGVGTHLKDFYTDYIIGDFNTFKRENIMEAFKNSEKAILSNVRCLIEGVDVPNVEMVYFADPKFSGIDIVQAMGRPLRNRKQDKKFGYALVPIFVETHKGEKITEALKRTNYENIIQIAKALRDHDDEVAEIIDEILTSESRGKGYSDRARKKLREIFSVFSSIIDEEDLYKAISLRLINELQTYFDVMLGKLQAYKDKHGHVIFSDVKTFQEKLGKNLKKDELNTWVNKVRLAKRSKRLYSFQIQKLESMGLSWSIEGETLDNINGLMSEKEIQKKLYSQITPDRQNKLIKPAGTFHKNHLSYYYNYNDVKKYMIEEKKITIFDTWHTGVVNAQKMADLIKVPGTIIRKLHKQKKIKEVGYALSHGVRKGTKTISAPHFVPITYERFCELMGYKKLDKEEDYIELSKIIKLDGWSNVKHTFIKNKLLPSVMAFKKKSSKKAKDVKGRLRKKDDTQVEYVKISDFEKLKKHLGITIEKKSKNLKTAKEAAKYLGIHEVVFSRNYKKKGLIKFKEIIKGKSVLTQELYLDDDLRKLKNNLIK